MKNILFFLLLLPLLFSCHKGKKNTINQKDTIDAVNIALINPVKNCLLSLNLLGKVKTVFEIHQFLAAGDPPELQKHDSIIMEFDQKANIIYKRIYNSQGILRYKNTYKYNIYGDTIEEATFISEDSLLSKFIYKYNQQRKMIEMSYYESQDGRGSKLIFKYDDKGNKIEEGIYNVDGSLREKTTFKYNIKNHVTEFVRSAGEGVGVKMLYKYDEKGNMIEEGTYNAAGSWRETTTHRYDSVGNKIEDAHLNNEGNVLSKINYKFDNKRNNIEALIQRMDGTSCKFIFKYDNRGNKIEEVFTNNGKQEWRNTFKFDGKGNKVEENAYGPNGTVFNQKVLSIKYDSKGNKIEEVNSDFRNNTTDQYEYDNTGNWIKKKTIYNGKITTIIEREIKYY